MLKSWLVVRALACATFAMFALLVLGGANAAAASTARNCGVTTPTNETPVSSYSQLQSDLNGANAAGTSYYLTTSLSDSASTPGGLMIPAESDYNSVTIDLNGCSLSITHPGTATPAITVQGPGEAPQLNITDSSTNDSGTLTVLGGAASSTEGAGAGIEIGSPAGEFYVAGVDFAGGTVRATGGSASSGTTTESGAGAGIGGNGGASGVAGGSPAGIEVDSPATVIATGGASDATETDDGGGGAGIGGGGGGASAAGGSLAGSGQLDGGTVTATGGAVISTDTTVGAGAGYGGGGSGSGVGGTSQAGNGGYVASNGGTLAVTAGSVSNNAIPQELANGFGPGGGATTVNGEYAGIDLDAGTTNVSGEVYDGIDDATGASLNVPDDATLVLVGGGDYGDNFESNETNIEGGLTLAATSTLVLQAEILDIGTNITLGGTLDADIDSSLDVGTYSTGFETQSGGAADLTLAGTINLSGGLLISQDGTLTVPAGQNLQLQADGSNRTVENNGTIDLSGKLSGGGTLNNDGNIVLSGSEASIPGHGQGGGNDLTISGNDYDVSFSVPAPAVAPADEYVYADTFADGDESLPPEPALSGYSPTGWEDDYFGTPGTAVTNTTVLSRAQGGQQSITLTGGYQFNGIVMTTTAGAPTEASDGVGSPDTDDVTVFGGAAGSPTGTVQFYVCGPEASATGCASTANPVGDPQQVGSGANNTAFADSPGFTPSEAGTYCFYAVYSGDAHDTSSADGSSTDQCFGVDVPTVTVSRPTSSANPTLQADTLKLSTAVTAVAGSGTVDSGHVAFFVNGYTTVCLADVVNGKAACDTASLPVGTDRITARYDGSASFGPSDTSAALTEKIRPLELFKVVGVTASGAGATHTVQTAVRLPGTGTLRVAVSGAGRTVARTERVKAKRVTVALGVRSMVRALAREHTTARQAAVRLRITFTPAGGHAHTVTRSLRVTIRRR